MSSRTNGAAITQDRAVHDRHPDGPAGPGRAGVSYLPGLDGLRALAIIAVLIFHANPRWLPGGFLGVDLFFVLSGFIITRALVAEWDARGRVDIGQFWLRRARRLLPAVFLLITGVLVYCAFFERGDVARLRQDTLAALAYATNWYQISGGQSYFASLAPPSLLQHLWSLAVEEQFYLVWPLVLSIALIVLPRRLVAPLLVLGAAASTVEMLLLYQHGASVSRLYYGTDTRAAGLLIGSALALSPMLWVQPLTKSRHWAWVRQGCGWLSLALLVGICLSIDDSGAVLYNGGFAVVSLASAGLMIAAVHPAALLSRVLERTPLRWLGRRSYGIYLWHWPIFVLMQPHVSFAGGALLVSACQVTAAIVIAAISYRFLEEPIRHGALTRSRRWLQDQLRRRAFTASWALGMSTGLMIFLAIWIVRIPAPALPSYFALTHVQITSAAVTATPTAAPVVRPAPTTAAPTATMTHVAPTLSAVLQPATQTPLAGPTSSDSSSASSASSASLVYAPTVAAPSRALPPASSARVTAIGDSVMLGAAQQLAAVTPGIYVDAQVGRQVSAAIALLRQLQANGQLGGILLIDMGNNGTFTDAEFDEIMTVAGPARRVVFVNLKEPRSWEVTNNAVITRGVARYANSVLVDWHDASINRPDLFWSDLIHLRPEGASVYANLIAPFVNG